VYIHQVPADFVDRDGRVFPLQQRPADVDVVLLNRAPVELAYAVIIQGTLLFEQDTATRIEYEADA
jgi:hypothetical protein